MQRTKLNRAILLSSAVLASFPAQAQTKGEVNRVSTLEEVVVTAQHRAETVQDIPLAVSAISGDSMIARGITDLADLSSTVPGFYVTEQVGLAKISLRGIGVNNISTGSESSIAFNQDGIFYSRPSAALASFYDVNRVEVLRGPQGTLYGRNATGGTVNIITNRPTQEFEGRVDVTLGNYDTTNIEGYFSGGLSDLVAARLAYQVQHRNGYGKNIVTGNDIDDKASEAIRLQVLYEPSDKLSILLGGDYYQSDDSSNTYHHISAAGLDANNEPVPLVAPQLGGYFADSLLDVASQVDPVAESEFSGARLELNYAVSESVGLKSLTSLRKSKTYNESDIGPSSVLLFPVFRNEESDQATQELQLNIDTDINKFVAGLYYFEEKMDGNLHAPLNLQVVGSPVEYFSQGFWSGGRLETEAVAIYAQNTYSVTDRLRFTVGGRYGKETKEVNDNFAFDFVNPYPQGSINFLGPQHDKKTFESFTPKIGVDFDIGDETMVYASYTQGFKSGTYNVGSMGPALDPEEVDAYEVGFKSTLLDGRFRANISAFYYDYDDLQVGRVRGTQLVLENAATARIRGFEAELTATPTDNLIIGLNLSYLNAEFVDYITADQSRPAGDGVTIDDSGINAFNLAGNALPQAPDYTVFLSVQYDIELSRGLISLRGESNWSDRVYWDAFERDLVSQKAVSTQNAFISYEPFDGNWNASLFAKNIGDEEIIAYGSVATSLLGSPQQGFVRPPRTYGLRIGYQF